MSSASAGQSQIDLFHGRPDRVSLADVAEKAGVSKATASRALKGSGRISAETTEKVRRIAQKLGYAADPALSALSRYRWGVKSVVRSQYSIALVDVNPGKTSGLPPATFTRNSVQSGVVQRAAALQLILEEHVLDRRTTPATLARILHARNVDGILFNITGPVLNWDFPWHRFCCVTIGFDAEEHQIHTVTSDWFPTVRMAVSRALATGHRRIGFANFFRGNPSIDDRLQATIGHQLGQLQSAHGPQPEVFHYPSDGNPTKDIYQTEKQAFLEWFRKQRPDVVIDSNSFGYWWLKEAGVRMPEDVSYISLLADTDRNPEMTGALHPRELQGQMAVDLLFNLIQMNRKGTSDHPMRLTCACEWNEGRTLASAPGQTSRRTKRTKSAA